MRRTHRYPWGRNLLAAAACVFAAACSGEAPPPAASTPAAPAPAPAPPPGPKLYVSDETGGAVIVIDAASGQVVERIAVGKRPRGIRVSRDGTNLFVALSGSPIAGPGVDESKLPPADRDADGIGVVDLATHKLVRTLKSGQDPEAFDLSPDGATMYVSNEETAEMSVIDIASGTVRERVKVGEEPEGVTVRPDGREVYVTCEGTNEVVAIDTTTLKVVGRMKTAARPRSVAFTQDGATAFVTAETAATISVIDTAKHTVATSIVIPKTKGPTAPRPMGAVLSPDGQRVYVSLRPGEIHRCCRCREARAGADDRRHRRSAVGDRRQRRWQESLHGERSVRRCVGRGSGDRHRRAPHRHRRQPVGVGDQVGRMEPRSRIRGSGIRGPGSSDGSRPNLIPGSHDACPQPCL